MILDKDMRSNPEILKSLNGGYRGLWGEVVDSDCYLMRDVNDREGYNHKKAFDFIPDVILDLGANVGVFSRYARCLFPNALIIAVEPDKQNILEFKKYTKDDNLILYENGIGGDNLYHKPSGNNGTGEVYLSPNFSFNENYLTNSLEQSEVKGILLTDLQKHIKPKDKVLCKIDIEGNETSIFEDSKSLELLRKFHYVTMELHYFSTSSKGVEDIKTETRNILESFNDTHFVVDDHPNWHAVKNNFVNKNKLKTITKPTIHNVSTIPQFENRQIKHVKHKKINKKPPFIHRKKKSGVNSIIYKKRKEEQEKYKYNGNKT